MGLSQAQVLFALQNHSMSRLRQILHVATKTGDLIDWSHVHHSSLIR